MRTKLRCNSDAEQSVGQGWCWTWQKLRPLQGQKGQSICTRGDEQPGKASKGRERLRDSRGQEPGQGSCPMGAPRSKDRSTAGSPGEMLTPGSSNSTDRTHLRGSSWRRRADPCLPQSPSS